MGNSYNDSLELYFQTCRRLWRGGEGASVFNANRNHKPRDAGPLINSVYQGYPENTNNSWRCANIHREHSIPHPREPRRRPWSLSDGESHPTPKKTTNNAVGVWDVQRHMELIVFSVNVNAPWTQSHPARATTICALSAVESRPLPAQRLFSLNLPYFSRSVAFYRFPIPILGQL